VDGGDIEQFYVSMRPRLVGFLGMYCGDAAVGEELAQETLARVWARWPKVRRLGSPQAWAYRVWLNLATSVLRRRMVAVRAHRRLTAQANVSPSELDHALHLDVRRAVAALPRRQRAAVMLRFFADLSVEETADAMSCAPGTVKALTHQAVTRLRETLGNDEFVEVRDGT
jgi:RNA polymerase sigma-70 factor (sigma-E family)